MSKTKGACHPLCYTKGRGCIISNDGRCTYLFAKQGEPGGVQVNSDINKNYLKQLDERVSERFRKGRS